MPLAALPACSIHVRISAPSLPLLPQGNAARYINHSCEPNSVAENVVDKDKKHYVCIFTGDKGVKAGQEITYDYQVSG